MEASTAEYGFSYTDNSTEILDGNFTVAPTVKAFFDGDLLLHPFWYPYRPMIEEIPPIVHYILGIYIAIVGIIGISGNILIIYMFVTIKSLRTPSNLFIINMAISDLGFSAVNGFPLMTISCFMKKWYFGKIWCELYAFLGGLFGFNSINSLAWISYDRMYVITKPFEAMRNSTMKRSALQLLFVWGWAIGWSMPPLVGWGGYIPEGFMTSCSFDYLSQTILNISYVWSMFAFAFAAPVLMIVYCYWNIIRAVTSQAREMNKTAEKMGAKAAKDEKSRKQEIALAKVAAVTITFFMLSWLPYAFVSMGAMAGFTWLINPYTCVIPVLFAKASAIWNPILYSLSHPRFRAALDDMFPALVLCRGMCMDKGGDDPETSDDDAKGGKKGKGKLGRTESSCSEVSEITDTGSSAVVNEKVQMSQNPTNRGGGQGPARPAPPQNYPQRNGLQPQEPRVAPGSPSRERDYPSNGGGEGGGSRRHSFRQSIGRAAGEAYKNLIDAYVGLKNVSDKLGDKRSAMTLEENHPAASRRSSAVGYENPAYVPNIPPSPQHAPVYSVPVMYQPQMPQQQPIIQYQTAPGYVIAPGAQMPPHMMGAMQAGVNFPSSAPIQNATMAGVGAPAPIAINVSAPTQTAPNDAQPTATLTQNSATPAPTPATPAPIPAAPAPTPAAPVPTPAAPAPTPAAPAPSSAAPASTPAAPAPTPTAPASSPAAPASTPAPAPTPAAPTPTNEKNEEPEDKTQPSASTETPLPPPPPEEDDGAC